MAPSGRGMGYPSPYLTVAGLGRAWQGQGLIAQLDAACE